MILGDTLRHNLAIIRQRIERTCERAKRNPNEVTLVCASKAVAVDVIREAYEAGARDFGENYAQELRDKAQALADLTDLRWHFFGALQRNKVKYVAGRTTLIHSVESTALVEEIDRRAKALNLPQDVLLQLNLARETTKSGITEQAVEDLLQSFASCTHCRCVGLMTMPPYSEDPEAARPLFAWLRTLRQKHAATSRPQVDLCHLSMGMSHDFEVAIEEGATLIRVGTAVFGSRR